MPDDWIAENKRSDAGDDDWTLQAYAREVLSLQPSCRRVVLWALYSISDRGEP